MKVSAPSRDESIRVDDGVAIHARVFDPPGPSEGDAPAFLLVHGLSSNARLWDAVATRLALAGHRAVAIDQRSHGRSSPSDDLRFERLAEDLVAVTESLGLMRPVAVGQSWGGNVVLELAARHPAAVRAVVGVDGGLIDLHRRFVSAEACWAALAPPSFDGLTWADLAAHVRARCAGWPDGAAEAQLANFAPPGPQAEVSPARPILTRDRHRTIVEHLYHHRPVERLAALEVPMLLLAVTGGGRRVVDEALLEEARAAHADRLEVVRLPGRDHDVHLEEPDTIAGLLAAWAGGGQVPEVVAAGSDRGPAGVTRVEPAGGPR